MKISTIKFSILIIASFLFTLSNVKAQAIFDIESGLIIPGYNNVRIPGDKGTQFSFQNDIKSKDVVFIRLRAGYIIKSRHSISALYAPLTVKSEGAVNKNIAFQGVVFPSNTQIRGSYTFNSYRITYRYSIIRNEKTEFGLGITAKIRDAEITLNGGGLSAKKTNVGFVPIINFKFSHQVNQKLGILLEGDALAAPQGRAEDILIAATYKLSDKFTIRTGYRILEGGSDGKVVYNFTLFHYASFGISISF